MMLLLMAVVQLGLWWHTRAVVTTAANKGLDAARAADGTSNDGHEATDAFLVHAPALDNRSVDVSRGAESTSVVVSGHVRSLIFGIPLGLTVTAEAPTERVLP
jgi:TadE-like protein